MENVIYINVRQHSNYGRITSLDVSVGHNSMLTACTYPLIMRGKQFKNTEDMLRAGANFVDIKNVTKIVTGTPKSTFLLLCKLNEMGIIDSTFSPKMIVKSEHGKSLTSLIKSNRPKPNPKPKTEQPLPKVVTKDRNAES